jgi:hypothetical protein
MSAIGSIGSGSSLYDFLRQIAAQAGTQTSGVAAALNSVATASPGAGVGWGVHPAFPLLFFTSPSSARPPGNIHLYAVVSSASPVAAAVVAAGVAVPVAPLSRSLRAAMKSVRN